MRKYNGAPANIDTLASGTTLWRIHRGETTYPPNSFNAKFIAPLVDALKFDARNDKNLPRQGRFDPVHDEATCSGGSQLGGYLYAGLSKGAAVAEGILRSQSVPPCGLLPDATLDELSITKMTLQQDVPVAVIDSQTALIRINQDASLTGCSWREYRDSRIVCTQILISTPDAYGVRYKCRNGMNETAVMLIDRGEDLALDVESTSRLADPGWGRDLVLRSLSEDFGVTIDRQ